MPADTAQPIQQSTGRPGKLRAATLDSLDGRTKAARQARELMDALYGDMGGADTLSAGERQIAQRAAVLGTLLESQEASWIAGDGIDLADYLPAANAQRRLLETLGLRRRVKDVPTLAGYLSRKEATA